MTARLPLVLAVLLGVWAYSVLVFSLVAWKAVRRLVRRTRDERERAERARGSRPWPGLAILRPCEGLDPELEANLLSTVTARYDGPRAVYLLVPSEADPAWAAAEAVRVEAAQRAPAVKVALVATRIETRHNRKVAQLTRGLEAAEADGSEAGVIVVIDSDLRLDDDTLPALIGALEADPRAGASSCTPVDVRRDTLGDRASAALLSSTPHAFLCLAALAERSRGAHVLCGALIAIHRAVLDEVGGFASLERFLGEDFELARRLHERGYTLGTASVPGRVTDHGRSLGWVVRRFARWATVTRQQRPHLMVTYPLFLASTPLLLSAGALALGAGLPAAPGLALGIGVVVAARTALAAALRRANGFSPAPHRALGALLLGEVVILVSAALALGRPLIEWRGRRYRVGKGGLIERLDA